MARLLWHIKTGEAKEFGDDEIAPPEYIDFHPQDPARTPPEDQTRPLTRAEVVAALKAGGITYDNNVGVAALTEQLTVEVKRVLTEQGIEFTDLDPLRLLLSKVQE